jgi:SET domain-containing protein
MPRCKCYAEVEGHPRILILETVDWDCKSYEKLFPYEEDIKVVCEEA